MKNLTPEIQKLYLQKELAAIHIKIKKWQKLEKFSLFLMRMSIVSNNIDRLLSNNNIDLSDFFLRIYTTLVQLIS